VILGAGGHGRVVADAAEAAGLWREIVFLDDRFPELRTSGDWAVVGTSADLAALSSDTDEFICAIGAAKVRITLQARLRSEGRRIANVVHPRATVSKRARLGFGIVVFAGACVNVGAVLHDAVIINTGATVDHDCDLAEGVHICPGAHLAGDVSVGRESWIGIGASVRQGVSIGDFVTIGAGAAVVSNVPASSLAVGVPARTKES
jgi:sugar O-acyltransferase (sialic acid O-acetyltransferase NeuD family)